MANPNQSKGLELARIDLAAYCAALWPKFEMAPHHRSLIGALERVESGDLDRLIVAMPPRHGKSLISSGLFPAWYLGRNPDKSIIASSYGQELASDFGRMTRNFIAGPIHQRIFPQSRLSDDSAAITRFNLLMGGAYHGVGAGGALTGRGAHVLLIDDPIKSREEAFSPTSQRSLQSWYESVAYPRLEPGGAIILIATRWHENDLSGWLMREHASEGWKLISMSAIAEVDEGWRRKDAPLWPQRYGLETLERIREAIGTASWLSLYQQRPTAEEGGIFKKDWWRRYAEQPEVGRLIFSMDTAFKTGQSSDYSVIEIWGEVKTGYALLHVWRARAEFPSLKAQAIALAEIWKPHAVLVEDAASGQSLIQSLKSETRLPIFPVKPLGDKVARASAVSPLVESGRVFLPDAAPWLNDFMEEASSFPAAPHDDQVDALAQALTYLRGSSAKIEYTPGWKAAGYPFVLNPARGTNPPKPGSIGQKPDSHRQDRENYLAESGRRAFWRDY
jgi:predicted phage terminase large subunit-like protein